MKAMDGIRKLLQFALSGRRGLSRAGRIKSARSNPFVLPVFGMCRSIACLALLMVLFGGICANECSASVTTTYEVVGVSNNDPGNVAIGESQLSVDVSGDNGSVLFVFSNTGAEECSITDVYFDDRCGLLSNLSIENSPGVQFSQWATPSNLPAGNNLTPSFETTNGLSADSDPPVAPNGVNPGEYLGIAFDIQGGKTYADVINCIESGELRVGLKVQAFANDGSETFVTVPAPGALLLGSLGICVVGWLRRGKTL